MPKNTQELNKKTYAHSRIEVAYPNGDREEFLTDREIGFVVDAFKLHTSAYGYLALPLYNVSTKHWSFVTLNPTLSNIEISEV